MTPPNARRRPTRRLLWLLLPLLALPAAGREPVAVLNGETIYDRDLIGYARKVVYLQPYLAMPGGPDKILDHWLNDRLLALEGRRLGIPEPNNNDETDFRYAGEVRRQLIRPCEPLDAAGEKAFYEQYPMLFATPLMLRVSRIGVEIGDDRDAARARLDALKQRIESGELSFAEAADAHSEDPLGRDRGGDIGFVPVRGDDPLLSSLADAEPDRLFGPAEEEGLLYYYRVTDRREPIVDEFAVAQKRVAAIHQQHCQWRRERELLAELRKRWPVERLVDRIDIVPERR